MSDHDHAPDDAMAQLGLTELQAMRKARELVHIGRVQLDWFLGRNWPDSVDWEQLNMGSECGCVLGQTFGNYWDGIVAMTELSGKPEYFSAEWERAREFADAHGYDLDDEEGHLSYADLGKLWREEVGR